MVCSAKACIPKLLSRGLLPRLVKRLTRPAETPRGMLGQLRGRLGPLGLLLLPLLLPVVLLLGSLPRELLMGLLAVLLLLRLLAVLLLGLLGLLGAVEGLEAVLLQLGTLVGPLGGLGGLRGSLGGSLAERRD